MSIAPSSSSIMEIDVESMSGESCSASSSGFSISSGTSRLTVKQEQYSDNESLATQESHDLIKLRFFLITILFWVTVGCGLSIWAYFTENQEEGFEEEYIENSVKVFDSFASLLYLAADLNVKENNQYISKFVGKNTSYHTEPFGEIFYPILKNIYEEITPDSNISTNGIVGILSVSYFWRDILKNMISEKRDGLHVVVENCNQTFTYTWSDSKPVYIGSGDLHESAFDHLKQSFSLTDMGESNLYTGLPLSSKGCQFVIHTYPSFVMLENYHANEASPATFTVIAVIIFIFTSMVFVFYDCLVERRQKKVYSSAVKNNAIVSSLFPKNVRDRLYKNSAAATANNAINQNRSDRTKSRLKTFMHEENNVKNADAPIADLFLNCTVLFADISGFTSWSSERSPGQVFVLLETIYGAFDRIADRRGVFKVETIGDCYMAVTGLPNPKKDHALMMAKFARDCRDEMNALTKSLEITLGTSDLTMRFGMHSGQVTAGVLRGQKSRFQLFGDTVNTAARMESTGIRNRIHISEETARLLTEAGKDQWLTPREETVQAKGKGELTTYWVFEKKEGPISCASTSTSSDSSQSSDSSPIIDTKNLSYDRRIRLIDWTVDLFAGSIRKIAARQIHCNTSTKRRNVNNVYDTNTGISTTGDGMVSDDVDGISELPSFDSKEEDPQSIHLDEDVTMQLRKYILIISSKYNKNPFHNFEHASHVTMSVAKLLSRIVAPDLENSVAETNISSTLHDHTYGITSDPLTQFACILAALIHDVGHQGVPNTVLIQEDDIIAQKYNGRSVAEQNSIDIAWALFLEPQFNALRNTVCHTDKELNRLRKLVVNMVMATDIMDKDLKKLRNQRWEKAFSSDLKDNGRDQDQINCKATVVLEHLIQASDVCHTMQHWHVYRKWNERLFEEMYHAYKADRTKTDPCTFWIKGELGFFDNYIIPLSKKLSDCGVFGVSSDEYLNYALRNRKEWELKGEAIVAGMVKKMQAQKA